MSETGAVEPQGRLARLVRWPLERLGGLARGVVSALPRAIEDLFRDRCPQYAASIAYRVLFSLFPLTIFLVSIFGLVLQDDEIRQRVIDELIDFLPVSPEGQGNIQRSVEGIASPLSAIGLVSLIALLWGATGMMASIRIGLEAALKVDRGRPAAHAKAVDLALVAITGLIVLLVVGFSAFAAFFGRLVGRVAEELGVAPPSGIFLQNGVQLVAVAVMALMLYRFVPASHLRARGAIAGAVVDFARDLGRDQDPRAHLQRLLALQPHLRVARRRDDLPLLRLCRGPHPALRRRVRVRVVTARRPCPDRPSACACEGSSAACSSITTRNRCGCRRSRPARARTTSPKAPGASGRRER